MLGIVLLFALAAPAHRASAQAEAAPYPTPEVRAWQTGLLRADRLQHLSLSGTLGLSCGIIGRSPTASFAGGFAPGLIKEFWDMRHSRFDWLDLAADAVGAAVSVPLTRTLVR